jgi:hypothetical protein
MRGESRNHQGPARALDALPPLSPSLRNTAPQCLPGFQAPAPSGPMQKGEGCNLKGFMSVNKVAGNFHIAFGDSVVKVILRASSRGRGFVLGVRGREETLA